MGFLLSTVILSANPDAVRVYSEKSDAGGFRVYADNAHVIPVFVHVQLSRITNLRPSVDLPFGTRVEPGSRRMMLFELTAPDPRAGRGFGLQYSYARGDPHTARHDDTHLYLLPFAHGTKHRVTQGYNGRFTHSGENQYALDFDLDAGTRVKAARAGTVVEIKQDSSSGGTAARYSDTANYVLIQHSDGSFANYAHLQHNGATVTVGQQVTAGRLIGYSGNTGRSSGPHLHFDVRIPTFDGRMQSIPTLFKGHDGRAISLEEHRFYYARHPGGPEFEVILGRDFTNSMFENHSRPVKRSDQLEFRTESIDLTYVAYLANGYDRGVEADISFTMRGVTSTVAMPRSILIPARTEIFLTILHADPRISRIQYAPRIRYRLLDR
ncbi:MAG: M23 family metallopeptidase [Spirochaetaceae bacterium]|nr:MAG: M23 family metallopeptidase [Spirochaetaceae bacterium]